MKPNLVQAVTQSSGGSSASALKPLEDVAKANGVSLASMLSANPGVKVLLEKFAAQGLIASSADGQACPVELNFWAHSPSTLGIPPGTGSGKENVPDQFVFIWQNMPGGGSLDFGGGHTERGAKLIGAFRYGDLIKAGILQLNSAGTDAEVGGGIQFQLRLRAFGNPGSSVTVGFGNGLVGKNGAADQSTGQYWGWGGGYNRSERLKLDATKPAIYPIHGSGLERFNSAGQLVPVT